MQNKQASNSGCGQLQALLIANGATALPAELHARWPEYKELNVITLLAQAVSTQITRSRCKHPTPKATSQRATT